MNDYHFAAFIALLILLLCIRSALRHAHPKEPFAPLTLKQTLRRLGRGERDLDKVALMLLAHRARTHALIEKAMHAELGDLLQINLALEYRPIDMHEALLAWIAYSRRRAPLEYWRREYWKRRGIYEMHSFWKLADYSLEAVAELELHLIVSIKPRFFTDGWDGRTHNVPADRHFFMVERQTISAWLPLSAAVPVQHRAKEIQVPRLVTTARFSWSGEELPKLLPILLRDIRAGATRHWHNTPFAITW